LRGNPSGENWWHRTVNFANTAQREDDKLKKSLKKVKKPALTSTDGTGRQGWSLKKEKEKGKGLRQGLVQSASSAGERERNFIKGG